MHETMHKIAALSLILALSINSSAASTSFLPFSGNVQSLPREQRSFLVANAATKVATAAPGCCTFDIGKKARETAAGMKDFLLGAVSGGFASFLVFPIDLAKTRIQNQKIVQGAELVYKNAVQTIFRVATTEGVPALYNGVAPVLVGAAPEAALQIGMNDKAKQYFAG
jgi:hypothetical protein